MKTPVIMMALNMVDKSQVSLEHIVLIGLNFQFKHSTGDKNFWVELIPLLAKKLKQITVISIAKHHALEEERVIENCLIKIKYLPPQLLANSSTNSDNNKSRVRKGAYQYHLGVIEKLLNYRKIIKELRELYNEHPYQAIHLMDNMGVVNRLIARKIPVAVSVSAMSYQAKKPDWLYTLYLYISYKSKKLTIIPYSQTYKDKLINLSLDATNVHRIQWGINTSTEDETSNKLRELARATLDIMPEMQLILWSGYIQQIQKKDFLYAYEIAKWARQNRIDAVFYFAFKPESFEDEFISLNRPDLNIFVSSTSVEKFSDLRVASDILFSPVLNEECILAPPLTWVEIMGMGKPIITTKVPGADEIIEEGKTGYIIENKDDFKSKVCLINKNSSIMKTKCIEKIRSDYNINKSASLYLEVWEKSL
jgi:glycosyltransferase involved in cell wall biosynthesis